MRDEPFFPVWLVALTLLNFCLLNFSARAQFGAFETAPHPINFKTDGIKFQIKASIAADGRAPYANRTYDHDNASLAIKIRISAHARESQFFGTISKTFSNFPMNAGSSEILFWQDARCHQRRGLPKTTVVAIHGSIVTDNGEIDVRAHPRQLGLPLPADEITPGIRLRPNKSDKGGPLITFRSESKASHLLVDVEIYATSCKLQ
jgi:hypothetical protein